MARLVGVDLPRDKRLEVALTYIYGVGHTRALETLEATCVSGDIRVRELSDEQLVALRDHIDANYQVEGDLRREVAADIRRKVEIGSYEGLRHRRGLPVRGQRTKTNARTRKGPKRTVAGKKKARKNLQRARYVFVRTVRRSSLYTDYFNPDRSVEIRVMGLEDEVGGGGVVARRWLRLTLAVCRSSRRAAPRAGASLESRPTRPHPRTHPFANRFF